MKPFGLTMAGIGSTAAGNLENNNSKYNEYELNTDFDINLYESLFRTHDPQIGRFLQIDPKAYELESPYSAMSNNPICNNDPFGDVTNYYNSAGKKLRSQDDGNDYETVTTITDENLDKFNFWALISDNLQKLSKGTDFEKGTNNLIVGVLGSLGVSYDSKEYFDYFDKHAKDIYEGNDAAGGTKSLVYAADSKGPLHSEHAAGTEIKDGYMRIMEGTDDAGTPIYSTPNGAGTGVHTHNSEGRIIEVLQPDGKNYSRMRVEKGIPGLGKDMLETAVVTNPSMGKFRVVVTPTNMYLYGTNNVIIPVERENVTKKNK